MSGPDRWHGSIFFTKGRLAYSHLAMSMQARDLAEHLRESHGVEPSTAIYGAWCINAERHARAHGVTLEAER